MILNLNQRRSGLLEYDVALHFKWCDWNIHIKIKRLLMKMVLLKYSLLHRGSELPPSSHGQMDSEILFIFKRTDPSLPDKHSVQWSSHLGFLFSRSGHHPFPIILIKGRKNGTKIPAKGYLWRGMPLTVMKIKPGIKFKSHLVKRKVKFFKT